MRSVRPTLEDRDKSKCCRCECFEDAGREYLAKEGRGLTSACNGAARSSFLW
jgi:hypothetical protein